jgi:hypothetical protein
MAHIALDSPFETPADPGVLTYGKLQDAMWRLEVLDFGACELQGPHNVRLMAVRTTEDLRHYKHCYTFGLACWEFSCDVNVDNVSVRFTVEGRLYEIPAIPPGGDYRPRVPRRVLALESGSDSTNSRLV